MIKIVSDYPNSKNWYVVSATGRVTLGEFCKVAREKAGLRRGQLETQAGLTHPVVQRYEENESNSITAMLVALECLGFNIEIRNG